MRNALYMLYLVRRGKWNGIEQGWSRVRRQARADEAGRRAGRRAGGWIAASCVARGLRVSTLVSSDLRGTQQTADIVDIGVGLTPPWTGDEQGLGRLEELPCA